MPDPKEPKEDDKVAAAYENISKKLESLRSGKDLDESEESNEPEGSNDGDELEEWKGPKPMKNPEVPDEKTDDDLEIRKVKLNHPENEEEEDSEDKEDEDEKDDEEKDDERESEESDESKESKESNDEESEPVKKWKPAQNDPLDEETEDVEGKDIEEDMEEDDMEKPEEKEPEHGSAGKPYESGSDIPKKQLQPDTLDDLTEGVDESASAKFSDNAEAISDKSADEEDDYFIPNLKGTGQRSNIGYNEPIEREHTGESYQKSSMDNQGFSSNNDPGNFFSQHSQTQAPKRASKFHLLILVIIGVVVIGFTVYILKGGFGDLNLTTQPSPSPSPVESTSPTPTPTPEPDRAQYKLKVLNGSGKTGLAASVSAKLKELGYQTEKTGNASNSAFIQTIVRVKPSLESFIPQIVKDLAPEFDAAGNTSLKDSETVDIEIILGAK